MGALVIFADAVDGHKLKVRKELFRGSRVKVMTVETRGDELHRLRGPPNWDYYAINVAPRRKWDGWRSYITMMAEGITGIPDDYVVVFVTVVGIHGLPPPLSGPSTAARAGR